MTNISPHIESIALASIYSACRLERFPQLFDEIAQSAHLNEMQLKAVRKTQAELTKRLQLNLGLVKPRDYLNRFASKLSIEYAYRDLGYRICDELDRYVLFQTSPPQVVVAGILMFIVLLADPTVVALDCHQLFEATTADEVIESGSSSSIGRRINGSTHWKNAGVSIDRIAAVCHVPVTVLKRIYEDMFTHLSYIVPSRPEASSDSAAPQIDEMIDDLGRTVKLYSEELPKTLDAAMALAASTSSKSCRSSSSSTGKLKPFVACIGQKDKINEKVSEATPNTKGVKRKYDSLDDQSSQLDEPRSVDSDRTVSNRVITKSGSRDSLGSTESSSTRVVRRNFLDLNMWIKKPHSTNS